MATLTIRLPDDQRDRLKDIALRRGLSVNKLFEEMSTSLIAQADTETWFRARAARGDAERGLQLLEDVNKHFAKK